MRAITWIAILLLVVAGANSAKAQTPSPTPQPALTPTEQAARDAARARVRTVLDKAGPIIGATFKQGQKEPYNFVGTMTTGLANADSLEIVISITPKNTIGFRIYPHYKGGYINLDKARDPAGLSRLLLRLSDRAFLFWGIDTTFDVFTGYTFTLESGFPEASLEIVLNSIHNSDKFVGEMRPFIDGSLGK